MVIERYQNYETSAVLVCQTVPLNSVRVELLIQILCFVSVNMYAVCISSIHQTDTRIKKNNADTTNSDKFFKMRKMMSFL